MKKLLTLISIFALGLLLTGCRYGTNQVSNNEVEAEIIKIIELITQDEFVRETEITHKDLSIIDKEKNIQIGVVWYIIHYDKYFITDEVSWIYCSPPNVCISITENEYNEYKGVIE